jgi:cell division protein FtsB
VWCVDGLCNSQGTVTALQQQVAALHGEVQQLLQQAEQLGGQGRQMLAQRMRAERHVTQLQVQ